LIVILVQSEAIKSYQKEDSMKKSILLVQLLLLLLSGCRTSPKSDDTTTQTTQIAIATITDQISIDRPSDSGPSEEPTATDLDTPSIEPSQTPEINIEPTPEIPPLISNWQVEYKQIYSDDFESLQMQTGFKFGDSGNANVTTDPDQVISGKASLFLPQHGFIQSNPENLHLDGNTTYLVDVDYSVLENDDIQDEPLFVWFQPEDGSHDRISTFPLLGNADPQGSYVAGALTSSAGSYIMSIGVSGSATVIIDNIRVIQQTAQVSTNQLVQKPDVSTIPFPRLGNYMLGTMPWISAGIGGEPPGTYSVNQLIENFSMYDVIVGADIRNQTIDPGLAYQLRQKNPNIYLLPYLGIDGQNLGVDSEPLYEDASIDIYFNFIKGLSNQWIMYDTKGSPLGDKDWGGCCYMNFSEFSPGVNGQTYNDYLVDWIINTILPSGEWDGIFFDNLFGRINFHISNYNDPAAIDFDFNLNGLRDETPALVSEMYRAASINILKNIREEVGDSVIIMGNTGPYPQIFLAPYVNGYTFECVDEDWYSGSPGSTSPSEGKWRRVLQEYFIMENYTASPSINILEGCGIEGGNIEPDHIYLNPTDEDIRVHRFTLGTTLLGDGFYEYDLFDARSAPYWFDEFTVDQNGVAEKDPQYKGYLGYPLGDAVELKSPATLIWEDDFEDCSMSLEASDPRISISQEAGDSISGACSLIIDNPDHSQQAEIVAQTDPSLVVFNSGATYLVEFDWRILESIDGDVESSIWSAGNEISTYGVPGYISGDGGIANFPFTLEAGKDFSLKFLLGSGGGKVAFDNIKVSQGGVGPWRRDFENGFVLVNPINQPYTFTPDELAGPLNRTGIKRILGTQAPEVNTGHFVTGSLTLEPFDAIILLADTIPVE
jgi:hypothetical protein